MKHSLKTDFKNYLLFFSIVICTFFKTTIASAQVNVQDSLSLVDLYNSTGGPSWTNKTGWLTKPVSTWYGITVTGNRVTAISLPQNLLNGTLPSTLGNLSALQLLDLDENASPFGASM